MIVLARKGSEVVDGYGKIAVSLSNTVNEGRLVSEVGQRSLRLDWAPFNQGTNTDIQQTSTHSTNPASLAVV